MKKKLMFCLLPIVACLASCNNNPPIEPENPADRIVYGNFITMDGDKTAEAAAIKDGKILALGTKDEVNKFKGSKTATDECDTSDYIYPGFVDTHTHFAVMSNILAGSAMIDRENKDYGGKMGDLNAYATQMNEFIKAHPGQDVYQGYGMWVMDQIPTASILDEKCKTDKPIVIVGAGGHDCWLNTAAIKKYVGNFEGTEDDKKAVDNWIIQVGRDCVTYDEKYYPHMTPTGYFCETARFRITDNLPHTVDQIKETILGLQEASLSKGYTTIGDCTIVESQANPQVTAFKELSANNQLKIKFRSYYEIREYDSKETRDAQLAYAKQLASDTKGDDYFEVVGIKVFLDGVYEALSAFTLHEYTPESGKKEGYKGIQRWYESGLPGEGLSEDLKELVYNANKAGLAMEFHAMGDAAVRQALDACQYSNDKLTSEGKEAFKNNAISHLGYINDADLSRFNSLGVTAVVAPQWAPALKSALTNEQKTLGNENAEKMYPIKSLIDTGANVAFHTDGGSVGAPDMIYSATTRLATNLSDRIEDAPGQYHVRGQQECITGLDCLKCLTVNAAKALNSTQTTGLIKVGAAADFTIYNKDYRKDNVAKNYDDYKSVQLKALYINGKDVLKAN